MSRPITPLAERFWPRVDKSRGPDACWPWTGYVDRDGYGRVAGDRTPGERADVMYAHRAAFLLTHGYLTPGLEVMHTCDNRPCCNPGHLVEDTHLANVADCQAKGRHRPYAQLDARIHELREAGHSQSSIGRTLDVSQQHVSNVLRRGR